MCFQMKNFATVVKVIYKIHKRTKEDNFRTVANLITELQTLKLVYTHDVVTERN